MMVAQNSVREARRRLEGLRVLVVEDEYMVAMLLEDFLHDLGCEVIGPATSARRACEILDRETPDLALLDINLNPGTSEPVARALEERGCPFMYLTGYDNLDLLPEGLQNHLMLQKPVSPRTFAHALARLVRQELDTKGC